MRNAGQAGVVNAADIANVVVPASAAQRHSAVVNQEAALIANITDKAILDRVVAEVIKAEIVAAAETEFEALHKETIDGKTHQLAFDAYTNQFAVSYLNGGYKNDSYLTEVQKAIIGNAIDVIKKENQWTAITAENVGEFTEKLNIYLTENLNTVE
jgi:hypothetical protein